MDSDRYGPITEVEWLREELAHTTEAVNVAQYLRDLVKKNDIDEQRRRRKDGFKFPSEAYETLEDLGKIEACVAIFKTLWHKNGDFRKASMHLTKLEWDLRKKLQEYL